MSREKNNKMLSYFILFLYVLTSSLGMVMIKKGGSDSKVNLSRSNLNIEISSLFFAGILLYIISFVLWIYILQKFTLTYISPVAYGLVFIFIAIFSFYFLSTPLTKKQIISAILIILGIVIGTNK